MDPKEYTNLALEESYNSVSKQFSNTAFFQHELLEQSRLLFEIEKESQKLKPQRLDVVAILLGLEFSSYLQEKVTDLQSELSSIIGEASYYWVKPKNLALEVAVLSWPESTESGNVDKDDVIRYLMSRSIRPFEVHIKGFQIHSDGCVILRVYDDGVIRGLRDSLITEINGFPNKQSSWCHIPIGRILSPLDLDVCNSLIEKVTQSLQILVFNELIKSISLVHEKRWYMEDVEILYKRELNDYIY